MLLQCKITQKNIVTIIEKRPMTSARESDSMWKLSVVSAIDLVI